jgi:CRISPR-associated endonuclease/helicase Cas3
VKLLAHIWSSDGDRKEQSLQKHCEKVAIYAAESLNGTNFYHMGYLAGLLHDMGKATKRFNDYLEDAAAGKDVVRGSVNHTFAGVVYLLEKYHKQEDIPQRKLTSEIIAYAMGSHHGLFDCVDLEGKNGFSYRLNKDKEELCYEEAVQNFFKYVVDEKETEIIFDNAVEEFCRYYEKLKLDWNNNFEKVFYQIGMLARLVLSAVIYGDRRDTSESMNRKDSNQEKSMNRIGSDQEKSVDWKIQREYTEKKICIFDTDTELNRVRQMISEQCVEAAKKPNGIYRLDVPTGGGKTLSTLRYAMACAEEHHKRRIIFIIPLLSVLDQNVKVIREFVKDDSLILEHHSNVVSNKESDEECAELDQYEILTESWDSPIIVSTLVQLLNILFTHKTTEVGRMHALCDSVIVIDEVQSIPLKTISMFNMAINFLSAYCNSTIVLSSATQPCLDELEWPVTFAEHPEMVRLKKDELRVFERAEIIDWTNPYGMDMGECKEFCESLMATQTSLLVICNTKSEARTLYEKLCKSAEKEQWYVCHLSTAMCQAHRLDVLSALQEKLRVLQSGLNRNRPIEKIVCISTQLVEAGIDFSFECVVRVLAGIDNLAQAAGRCNRGNEYGHKGKVYLINLKNENLSMLKEIVDAQNSTRGVLQYAKNGKKESLIGSYFTKMFYTNLFNEKDIRRKMRYPMPDWSDDVELLDLLANKNPYASKKEKTFLQQPFKTIGKNFKVFDDQTIDVLVPYKEGKFLIKELNEAVERDVPVVALKDLFNRTKRFSICIYQWQKEKLSNEYLTSLFEDRVFVLNEAAYDKQGLVDLEEPTVEDYIL